MVQNAAKASTLEKTAPDGGRIAAVWPLRRRWASAIGFALIPVAFTALASALAQIVRAPEAAAALLVAGGVAVSAVIGLVVMRAAPPSLGQYGFRAPRRAAAAWWFAPLPLTVVLVVATAGIHVAWRAALAYLVLTAVVAVNEEVWFRGVVLSVLRGGGARVAIVGSSALFGVLHLANLAGGEGPASGVLQLVFAVVFGLVAAELVVITGSLWPAIGWHAAWDLANYLGGNATSALALVGVGIACAVMIVYVALLWRRVAAGRSSMHVTDPVES